MLRSFFLLLVLGIGLIIVELSLKFFNFVSPVIERYHDQGYDLFALGDDFNNDLSFWLENYFAKGYLIDNDSSHLVDMKVFKKGNLNNSVGEIFEIS